MIQVTKIFIFPRKNKRNLRLMHGTPPSCIARQFRFLMVYQLQNLPQFPNPCCEERTAANMPWVDDDVVLRLTAVDRRSWHEQCYQGEDFAGRNDCFVSRTQEVPVSIDSIAAVSAPVVIAPISKTKPPHPTLMRRALATACATVIVMTAAALGLWAANNLSPKTRPSANNSKIYSLLIHR